MTTADRDYIINAINYMFPELGITRKMSNQAGLE